MLTVPSPSWSTSLKNCGGKLITPVSCASSTLSPHLHSFLFGDALPREKVYHLHHVHCGLEGHNSVSTLASSSLSLPLTSSLSASPFSHFTIFSFVRESALPGGSLGGCEGCVWRVCVECVWRVCVEGV